MKREAIIFRPSKSAMQSGTRNTQQWRLEIRSDDAKFVDSTMGWIGGRDTTRQLTLRFDSEEEAITYCNNNEITYSVAGTKTRKAKPKSYANNFATNRRFYADMAIARKIDL